MKSDREQLIRKFRDKDYRDAFIAEHIYSRLPLKIRALRETRGLSQKTLGERVGMAQTWVSKLEDPNYGKLTLSTLLRLASAFDVGLEIDFVPFSKVLDDTLGLTPESWEVSSFGDDVGIENSRDELRNSGVRGSKFYRREGCTRRVRWGAISTVPCKVPRISVPQSHSYPAAGAQRA